MATTTKKGSATPKVAMRALPTAVIEATKQMVGAKKRADDAVKTLEERSESAAQSYFDAGITSDMISKQNKEKREALGVTKTKLYVETYNAVLHLVAESCLTPKQYKLWSGTKPKDGKAKTDYEAAASRVSGYMGSLRTAIKQRETKQEAGLDPSKKREFTESEKLWNQLDKFLERIQRYEPDTATALHGKTGIVEQVALLRKCRDVYNKPTGTEPH